MGMSTFDIQGNTHALVSVSGPSRIIDLAVPLHTRIEKLIPNLARAVGENTGDITWVLTKPDEVALDQTCTFAQLNIQDGHILYLQDLSGYILSRIPSAPEPVVQNLVPTCPPKVSVLRKWRLGGFVTAVILLAGFGIYAAYNNGRTHTLDSGTTAVANPSQSGENSEQLPFSSVESLSAMHSTATASKPAGKMNSSKVGNNASKTTNPNPAESAKGPVAAKKTMAASTSHKAAVHIDAKASATWVSNGIAAHATGNDDAAIADYNKAISANPMNATAYVNLGNIYFRFRNNASAALPYYQHAVQADPHSYYAWTNLAACEYSLGNKANALSTVDKAVHALPSRYTWSLEQLRNSFK